MYLFLKLNPKNNFFSDLTSEELALRMTPMHLASSGYYTGLSILVDPQLEELSYSISSNIAPIVFVFDPLDFPDDISGTISQRYIEPGHELFVSLFPEKIQGSISMNDVAAEARGCVFHNEKNLKIVTE